MPNAALVPPVATLQHVVVTTHSSQAGSDTAMRGAGRPAASAARDIGASLFNDK